MKLLIILKLCNQYYAKLNADIITFHWYKKKIKEPYREYAKSDIEKFNNQNYMILTTFFLLKAKIVDHKY